MRKLKEWHKNYYYGLLENWDISSYQASWLSWFKGFVIGFIVVTLASCSTYQLAPVDKCCETDVVYLEDVKSGTTVFSTLDFNTITLDFRPLRPRFYWGHDYGHWGSRPLWMDFNFYYGNHYSYYSPYYSYFNRPWNHWDYYIRPWTPSNNWYQGPFDNQGYNVVYNSGRRGSLTESNKIANIVKNNTNTNNRPLFNKPVVNTKPVVNNKPIRNNTIVNNKPIWNSNNNSRPVIRNNSKPNYNNSKPSYNNSKPTNNSRPTISVKSRGGKNN